MTVLACILDVVNINIILIVFIFLLIDFRGRNFHRLSRGLLDLGNVGSVVEINFNSVRILGVRLLFSLFQPLDKGGGLIMDLLRYFLGDVLLGDLKQV